MSTINITSFFSFCRVRVVKQSVDTITKSINITVKPDRRYKPICYKCKGAAKTVHAYKQRTIRDLNVFDARTYLSIVYRVIVCPRCGYTVEESSLLQPYGRVTKRLASHIIDLCRYMTITEVAGYLGLDWRTVKKVHKQHLKESISSKAPPAPRILIVDEIAIRKGHRYLTIVADWENGTVLWVGKDRGYASLKGFFDSLSEEQRNSIEAVALDMWDPYIKAVRTSCPQAHIVFDQFHMVSAFGRVIDKVRNAEYRNASQEDKQVIKGSRYLLLKNKPNLSKEEKPRLEALLNLNQTLTTVYIFKDLLKRLWQYTYPAYAQRAIEQLSDLAHESDIGPLKAFVKTIKRYAYGIVNHCKFPIHTSRIEGMNNKIKVIKRKAYGFLDMEYFSLLIKNAFVSTN